MYHAQVRFKAEERDSKKTQTLWWGFSCVALTGAEFHAGSCQSQCDTHRQAGTARCPQASGAAHRGHGKHGHPAPLTHRTTAWDQDVALKTHPSEKPGFRFYLHTQSLQLHVAKTWIKALVHVGWHKGISDHRLPNSWVGGSQQLQASSRTQQRNSSRQLQLQPFHFLKYSLTAVLIHKADATAFQQENYDLNPWISILPDQVNSEIHWFHFFSFLNKILAVHTCGNKSSPK